MATIGSIISDILVREGGYVDNPADRGGPTKWGITQKTLSEWRGKPVDAEDVKLMHMDEAEAIYRDRYIVKPGFVPIPDPLRGLVVDCGVNHDTQRASEWLQDALGVKMDGKVGDTTMAALAIADQKAIYRKVLAMRARLYGRLIQKDETQHIFALGWANRLASFIEECP